MCVCVSSIGLSVEKEKDYLFLFSILPQGHLSTFIVMGAGTRSCWGHHWGKKLDMSLLISASTGVTDQKGVMCDLMLGKLIRQLIRT